MRSFAEFSLTPGVIQDPNLTTTQSTTIEGLTGAECMDAVLTDLNGRLNRLDQKPFQFYSVNEFVSFTSIDYQPTQPALIIAAETGLLTISKNINTKSASTLPDDESLSILAKKKAR